VSNYVKFTNPEQARTIYIYKNTEQKLCKTFAFIWNNKVCRINQGTFNWQNCV